MRYRYTHTATEATTGYFSCEPDPKPALGDALVYLAAHPLDEFMRRHLITRMSDMPGDALKTLLDDAFPEGVFPAAVSALLEELTLINPALRQTLSAIDEKERKTALETPLIFLRWARLPDKDLHRAWGLIFDANMRNHRALKAPGEYELPPLFSESPDAAPGLPGTGPAFTAPFSAALPAVHARYSSRAFSSYQRPPSAETAALAEERLASLAIPAGREMRHTASLSPVALLRPWNLRLRVRSGRHHFSLEGQATTYGRGFSVPDARASCLMEMVERASAYLSVKDCLVEHRQQSGRLQYGSRAELAEEGHDTVDPNDFPLETPYAQERLYWIQGEQAGGRPVSVPVQMASLFSNLDEIALFDAPGSTGIATGNTLEEAKLAALLEIIERDAEATTPFSKATCFTLETVPYADPVLTALLADYAARGINVQFQDLTGPLGIPVYKCFVMSPRGAIAAGHGAGLAARKAIVSALTETPFPYPDGGPSGPMLRKLPRRHLQELPDYTLPSPEANLAMLETLLSENGRAPVYVNLTHEQLKFPVVRCLLPGFELAADRDTFSRVPFILYRNYLRLFDE